MPKPSNASYNEEKYHSAFATVLREEFLKTPEDVKKLADYLQISPQAVNQFKQGQSFPKIENLIKIAQFYNCSLDYLIGLSDVHTPEADRKAVCEYTGLSEAAVWRLNQNVKSVQYCLGRGTPLSMTDEHLTRSLSRMIEKNLDLFGDMGKYLYSSYSGFSLYDASPEEASKMIMLKTPLGGANAEYTQLNISDVQELMLLKIEKKLREIREDSLAGKRYTLGAGKLEQTEDGKTKFRFIPYYQATDEDTKSGRSIVFAEMQQSVPDEKGKRNRE